MDYVSACYTDDAQTISLDYLAFDPFQINIQNVAVKKGYFCHITKDNVTVADCIVSDVKPGKELQEISLRPLQALFDAEVFYNAVTDAITWIGNNLTAQYINSTDTYQLRPLVITTTPGSRAFPLTGYNLNPTMNILSVITNAFRTWGVVTEASLDLVNKQILVNIFEQTATKTIECDLENVISSEVTLGDSYGSTNKLIVKKTVAEGSPTGTTEITYYRHTDGSISTTDTDRIVPVFWDVETLEQTEDMTDADWIAETETMAKETLTPAKYDNEVVISVWEDDKIVNPKDIALGTITTLYIKGTTYYSILTGETIEGNVYTLTFGAVRTELTKKLAIQSRSNGTSSGGSSGGGGGGGGGGDVTGVKGNAETVYRVGDVNLTPQNIGAVPTSTTVNGHALTGDITISKSDVGLGNVNNTSDLNKPISTATQTALDDKVDKETGKGLSTNDFTNALLTKLNGIETGAQVNTVTGVKGNSESSYRDGNVNITKANIGLGNVDNTSDVNKPVSNPTQTALNGKVDKETGKSLTSNDFTDALLAKLNGIESGAQVNTVTGVKGGRESTYRTGNISITADQVGGAHGVNEILNPFAPEYDYCIQLDRTDNAFYFADRRWTVTGEKTDSGGTVTSLLPYQVGPLFDMSEANTLNVPQGGKLVITMDFTGSSGTDVFPNYPYGFAYLDFYNNFGCASVTARVYGKHVGTESFWRDLAVTADSRNTAYHIRYIVNQTTMYNMQKLEFTINGLSNMTGSLSEISYYMTRANKDKDMPYVSKLRAETLFYNLTAPKFIGALQGNADTATKATQDGSGNNIVSTYATQTALNAKVNKTDIATTSNLGLVKPDGSTITIDADGTIHSMGGSGGGTPIYYFYQQRVSVASSAEILRISSGLITADTIVLECTFNTPSAISGGVTWTSYNGYISFIGTCIKATKANVVLANKGN